MYKATEIETNGDSINVSARELLPINVKPIHYDIILEPDFDKFTFDGQVVIDLDIAEKSNTVSLHTFEIKIREVKLSIVERDITIIQTNPELSYDAVKQVTTMVFKESLTAGSKAQIDIKFIGELNDKMAGFYRSYYKKPDGSHGVLATSQMEATDARRALPCFDEPALKAKFTVTLIAEKHLTCLSNMDVFSETEIQSNGVIKKAVKFRKSPLMSTYLLGFIVGELDYIETNSFRVPCRVYAPPSEDIQTGRFALETCARGLEFYEKAFDLPFPLPKMDQVAIPDLAHGAMENWGLITYRIVDVMFDEKVSSASIRERVTTIVLHELAHQWFGNLVTMDWWEGLWLNEGWAEWGARYSANAFYPEWKLKESFISQDLQAALSVDGCRSSHPIEVPVNKADEINQIFDAISYSKGSCIIRMIANYLGEDIFLNGVQRYLKQHMYGNTKTDDLWRALAEASGKNVGGLMETWTKNVGYPVVSVTEKDGNLHFEQHRFLTSGDVKPEDDRTLYPIFLNLRSNKGIDKTLTLTTREKLLPLDDLDFFQLNAGYTGFYRIHYTTDRLAKLGRTINLLSVQDRVGILSDVDALTMSGYQKASDMLGLLKTLSNSGESEYLVLAQMLSCLASIRSAWIEEHDVTQKLNELQKELFSPIAHKLGWIFLDSDGHVEQKLKARMFGASGSVGDEIIITVARNMFKRFLGGDMSAIHPNIRDSVFKINIRYGGEVEYDSIMKFYEKATNSDLQSSALRCLGYTRNPVLMKRTVEMLLSGKIRDQDIYIPLRSLRSSKEGKTAVWEWLQDEWDTIYTKFPATSSMIGLIVGLCTSGMTNPEQLAALNAFFMDKGKSGYDRALARSVDAINANIAWVKRDDADVRAWLGL